jgi:hypothetical protein
MLKKAPSATARPLEWFQRNCNLEWTMRYQKAGNNTPSCEFDQAYD